jgi:hypothetical protein
MKVRFDREEGAHVAAPSVVETYESSQVRLKGLPLHFLGRNFWGKANMILRKIRLVPLGLLIWMSSIHGEVGFNRDIRPIMSDTCFRCHGPDKNARMANLRLDIREQALKPTESGKTPIVPGKPEESEIVRRVFSEDATQIMPPEFSHKTLTKLQKETIRQWVAEGAKYEGHWSFQPVKRPAVPEVTGQGALIRNPIDAFVQSRLFKEGLQPSPEADRRTLIRRVSLDLTGLPPTAAEVEAFISDQAPNAYEKVVDRLLMSPRYAEQQAMLWLDAVRYADTRGFHNDIHQPAWPYRDYVLRAFLENKPFDLFTREQLAGDLLPNAGIEQKVATAYNRILRTSEEGGIQDKEYLAKYGADRVRTIGNVWLGLTMGCAECHDHKFDPVATKDFYSMKAFFADIKENGILPGSGPKAWAATLSIPSEEQKQQLTKLQAAEKSAQQALEEKTKELASRQAEWERRLLSDYESGRLKWHYQRPVAATSVNGAELTIYNDELVDSNFYVATGGSLQTRREPGNGLVVVSGPNPDSETYSIQFRPGAGTWAALGIQAIQDESLPAVRLARGADRFLLTEVEAEISAAGAGSRRKIPLALATSNGFGEAPENAPLDAIDGNPATGWGISSGDGRSPFLAVRFTAPLETTDQSMLTVRLHHDSALRRATIGRVRLALSSGEYSWPELGDAAVDLGLKVEESRLPRGGVHDGLPVNVAQALRVTAGSRSEAQVKALKEHFQWSMQELQPMLSTFEKAKAARAAFEADIPTVMVTEAVEPRETRILPRGNWMDDSGPVVLPAVPGFLGNLETNGRRATRLDLANWIVSQDNPLTARVFANRQWRQFFGTGLSKVLDDLGSQGEWPTHPELLDWLAAEFMEPTWQAKGSGAWDVKHLLRTIVLSHTYRQASATNPQLDTRDPDNRLLARQSRFRVPAENVRDIALTVSGLIKQRFGGPSVNPYQPDGYLAAMNFPKRDYSASRNDDLYRRAVYTYWRRTFLHPSLLAFDAPSREECTVNRVSSNTPLQALVLLNDPIFVEASRVLAQNMLKQAGPSLDARIDWAFSQALNRKPEAAERKLLTDLHKKSLDQFAKAPDSADQFIHAGEAPLDQTARPADLAAMMTVARAILNLHETITRN